MPPYAEVIGDPIAQSKSPLIHGQWLRQLEIEGNHRATKVRPEALADYLAARRTDPDWRGCNVTLPHKEAVLPLLDELTPGAAAIGAVNCITPGGGRLTGTNTDIEGVGVALSGAEIEGRKAVVIGGGGGARAVLRYLLDKRVERITILVREPVRAESLIEWDRSSLDASSLEEADAALSGARLIVNASPLGMAGQAEMSAELLAAVERHAAGAVVFDMVYKPLETRFLAAGRAGGAAAVDGLEMLIGQARAAFAAFFGREPPVDDFALREILTR